MISFWISFLFLGVSWLLALGVEGWNYSTILLSFVFFVFYFILPIVPKKIATGIYILLPILLIRFLSSSGFNGFIWLMYLALALHSTTLFKGKFLYAYVMFLYVVFILPYTLSLNWLYLAYFTLLSAIIGILLYSWEQALKETIELKEQMNLLKNDFQSIKRQLAGTEQSARQEERNQIAREIHDSVGHRLTALLMQMEVARLQASDEKTKEKITELKKLAQSSLHDTREAVNTLKSEETVGLQAVIQLIRKLESESQLRVAITMKTGVLGAMLSNQQSVTVYRSIQEALTNMMRHSSSRQVAIEFQIVAQRDLRFQVSHPLEEQVKVREGFGLMNMRERLSEIDGQLTIRQDQESFHLIGQFPLEVDRRG